MWLVYLPYQLLNAWTSLYETWFVYHGTLAHLNQSVCLYVYLHTVARQQLGKNVVATMNTQTTIEEFLDVSFSMQTVSYQKQSR
jgi:hypothetical protein